MSHIDEQIAEALTHGPDTLTYILAQALTTARARVAELEARLAVCEDLLIAIGDYAHSNSTGPAVPDALWEVRRMAYEQ